MQRLKGRRITASVGWMVAEFQTQCANPLVSRCVPLAIGRGSISLLIGMITIYRLRENDRIYDINAASLTQQF